MAEPGVVAEGEFAAVELDIVVAGGFAAGAELGVAAEWGFAVGRGTAAAEIADTAKHRQFVFRFRVFRNLTLWQTDRVLYKQ